MTTPPRLLAAGPTHYDRNGDPNTEYVLWIGTEVVGGRLFCTPRQHAELEAEFADARLAEHYRQYIETLEGELVHARAAQDDEAVPEAGSEAPRRAEEL